MALNDGAIENVSQSVDKSQEHNEMRAELIAAGFDSFGLSADEGIAIKNKDGKIVYLRDDGDGYQVFAANELPSSNEPLPKNLAIQEATRQLGA